MKRPRIKALLVNCTLKPTPKTSHTAALIGLAVELFGQQGVETETLRLVDYDIKPGTSSDEGSGDQWPQVFDKIKQADILVLGSPVWVGHTASTTQQVIERLDSLFHEKELQDKETGQYVTYNKVAGCLVTGNEDGAHSVVAQVLWAMQEFGFTVPPNANAYWVGEAGPGPSYLDAGGPRHLFTNKTLRHMVHNLAYMARLLKEHPIPTNLNQLAEEAKKVSDEEEESGEKA